MRIYGFQFVYKNIRVCWRDGLPEYDADEMAALAQRLEDVDDVRVLMDAFTATE